MPKFRGITRSLSLIGLLAFFSLLLACEEGPVLQPGDRPQTHGGVEFEIGQYEIRYLELTDGGETFEYPNPVLAFPIVITNRGEGPFEYRPTHDIQQLSEATTPLIYPAPSDPEADFRQNARTPLSGIRLERGRLSQQVQEVTTLAPGESLTDVFLFELPDPNQERWILSIPPTMHRAELPLFMQFTYREPRPRGPQVHSKGTAIDFDGVTFTVTGVSQEYIKLEDSNQGKGFSTAPVLKIAYTIENKTDEAITYDANHGDLTGRRGALLHSLHQNFNRARFPATVTLEGQKGSTEIGAGESIEDFAIFDRPEQNVESATFELAASHFQRSGRVRVNVSYEREEVAAPEEMQRN